MKVSQLIDLLSRYDADSEVKFCYNYGDYWRTEVAQTIRDVFEGQVEYSDYHRMDRLVTDVDDDEDSLSRNAVILA